MEVNQDSVSGTQLMSMMVGCYFSQWWLMMIWDDHHYRYKSLSPGIFLKHKMITRVLWYQVREMSQVINSYWKPFMTEHPTIWTKNSNWCYKTSSHVLSSHATLLLSTLILDRIPCESYPYIIIIILMWIILKQLTPEHHIIKPWAAESSSWGSNIQWFSQE